MAHRSDTACSSATSAVVAAIGPNPQISVVTIGSDGLGLVSYYEHTNGDLRVVHLSNRLGLPVHRQR